MEETIVICSICLSNVANSPTTGRRTEPRLGALNCGHLFHANCLFTWFTALQQEKKCPVCNAASTTHFPHVRTIFPSFIESHALQDSRKLSEEYKEKIIALERKLAEKEEQYQGVIQRLNERTMKDLNLNMQVPENAHSNQTQTVPLDLTKKNDNSTSSPPRRRPTINMDPRLSPSCRLLPGNRFVQRSTSSITLGSRPNFPSRFPIRPFPPIILSTADRLNRNLIELENETDLV